MNDNKMTALQELVLCEREIKAAQDALKEADHAILDPIRTRERIAGERANVLWRQVLAEYGPGTAQDALRAALGEQQLAS